MCYSYVNKPYTNNRNILARLQLVVNLVVQYIIVYIYKGKPLFGALYVLIHWWLVNCITFGFVVPCLTKYSYTLSVDIVGNLLQLDSMINATDTLIRNRESTSAYPMPWKQLACL